jgi:hypothetical protein
MVEGTDINYLLPGEKGPSGPTMQAPAQKPNKKKQKRLEKFITSQLKKEKRIALHAKLSKQILGDKDLLLSSKRVGVKLSAKERLKQAYPLL